jgi:hypothetical protein
MQCVQHVVNKGKAPRPNIHCHYYCYYTILLLLLLVLLLAIPTLPTTTSALSEKQFLTCKMLLRLQVSGWRASNSAA